MTPERILEITEAANIINLCSRVINITHQTHFDGRLPAIGNHSRRIRESAAAIPQELSRLFYRAKTEEYCVDISLELYDVINFFQDKKPEQIQQILKELRENKLNV